MNTKLVAVFICILSCFICNYGDYAIGAEIFKSEKESFENFNGCMYNILIYGDIEKGDSSKFKALVQEIKQANCTVGKVSLISHGGEVFEAMEIGSVIRKNIISTEAPLYSGFSPWLFACSPICNSFPNIEPCLNKNRDLEKGWNTNICGCDSSCFLIWASGVIRMSNGLGLHRPYFSQNYFQGLSSSEAQKKYDDLSNAVREYLISMDIPADIIDKMFSHSSEDIYYLPQFYEKDIKDSKNFPALKFAPFFEEWMIAKCGSSWTWTVEEEEIYLRLMQKDSSKLTIIEKYALEGLLTKSKKSNECITKAKRETQLNMKE